MLTMNLTRKIWRLIPEKTGVETAQSLNGTQAAQEKSISETSN